MGYTGDLEVGRRGDNGTHSFVKALLILNRTKNCHLALFCKELVYKQSGREFGYAHLDLLFWSKINFAEAATGVVL